LNEPAADTLAAALARHQLQLPAEQIEQLDRYRQLLWEWNERMNLTRHTDFERFVSRDVLDSHQLAQLVSAGESVLDFGTGGGVPGVVVAILRPDVRVAVCDSVGKKAKAVEAIVKELGLDIPVYAVRAEQVLAKRRFDVLMARAVGSLADVLKWLAPHWNAIGRMLLVKGPKWVEERGEARHRGLLHGIALRVAATYPMPGTYSESVILKLVRDRESPATGEGG
jgi:16S rRNA (guanine527-N7)-methyltransferase